MSERPCGDKKHHPNATDPYSYEDWKEMVEWDLEEKVKWSKRKLLTELKKSTKPAVSFSGGKSSEVALHLALSFDTVPKVRVVYNDTGVVFPETTPFVKKLSKKWDFDLTITEPEKTFFQCVEEYGWPEPRSGGPGHGEPRCCYWLKMRPMKKFVKKNDIDLFVTGEQGTESMNRRVNFLQYGASFRYEKWCSKKHQVWKCKPVVIWTDDDIWNYLRENDLPINPAYEEYGIDRTGCFTCTGFDGWEEKMRNFSKELYQRAKREKDDQLLLEEFT